MESKLQRLLQTNSGPSTKSFIDKFKNQGGKVIGLLCPYVPEEVIMAAGMLPLRLTGNWKQNVGLSLIYRPANMDLYYSRVLESIMEGEFDYLDGIIVSNRDDDLRRLRDALVHINRLPVHIVHVPHMNNRIGRNGMVAAINTLIGIAQDWSGVIVNREGLHQAIVLNNKVRDALQKLNEMRQRDIPPLSGSDYLRLSLAARILPKDEFLAAITDLLPYIEQRKYDGVTSGPRILVSSDNLDNPAYLELIENIGALVAMDDLDTGVRYFSGIVDESKDPVEALAERYLSYPACPRMSEWDVQLDRVIGWARDHRIDGVIELPQMYYYPREFRVPFFREKLQEVGIPSVSIKREYHLANVGQIQTRIEAFIEMLSN